MIRFFWRFLRESEKTRAKCQGIDSGSPRVLNQNGQKKLAFQAKLAEKAHKNPNFVCQMIKKHVQKFLQKWLHEAFCDISHIIGRLTSYSIFSEFLLKI
jgi:hypothetical protein